jgi:hypothetical protein
MDPEDLLGNVSLFSKVRLLCICQATYLARLQACKGRVTFQLLKLPISMLTEFFGILNLPPPEGRLPSHGYGVPVSGSWMLYFY